MSLFFGFVFTAMMWWLLIRVVLGFCADRAVGFLLISCCVCAIDSIKYSIQYTRLIWSLNRVIFHKRSQKTFLNLKTKMFFSVSVTYVETFFYSSSWGSGTRALRSEAWDTSHNENVTLAEDIGRRNRPQSCGGWREGRSCIPKETEPLLYRQRYTYMYNVR